MDKVQIIPPPKGVDPRALVWKGAAVLGKMDGVSDLWLTASDWVSFWKLHDAFNTLALTRAFHSGPLGDTRASGTMFLLITRFYSACVLKYIGPLYLTIRPKSIDTPEQVRCKKYNCFLSVFAHLRV
jgi:hypothetical protein